MRFRLLTYNIHRAIGTDRRFSPTRIADVIRHYDPDIALLQEVDRGVPRSDKLDLAATLANHLKYPHRAVGMNVYLKQGRYGNATLSRYPISRQRNHDLTIGWWRRRGAQHARIHLALEGTEFPVDVFNTHLGLSATERATQAARLLNTPDLTTLPPDQPCIIAGDMNDWRGVLHRWRFAPAGFHNAAYKPGAARPLRTWPSFAPTGALDRIYYRGRLQLIRCFKSRLHLARVASDHLPLIADFVARAPER